MKMAEMVEVVRSNPAGINSCAIAAMIRGREYTGSMKALRTAVHHGLVRTEVDIHDNLADTRYFIV